MSILKGQHTVTLKKLERINAALEAVEAAVEPEEAPKVPLGALRFLWGLLPRKEVPKDE